MKIMNARFTRKIQVAEAHQVKTGLSMLSRRQIAHMIHLASKPMMHRAVMFEQAWEETLMGMEKEKELYKTVSDGHRYCERSAREAHRSRKGRGRGRPDAAVPAALLKGKRDHKRGDCRQWTAKSSCSEDAQCSFMNDGQILGKM